MSMFGISIYPSPEHFIALYLGLFTHKQAGLRELGSLLSRTKNPPIAAIYTHQLLQDKSWDQYSLEIVRFLSQLSDLSDGTSMSTSLYGVINESSLLTEIRHNLTHKVKISNTLVQVCYRIVVAELRDKYWDATFAKYMEYYNVDLAKIHDSYERIYGEAMTSDLMAKIEQSRRKIDRQWLVKESSNYEFKEFFMAYAQGRPDREIVDLIEQTTEHKKAIAIACLIKLFCLNNRDQNLCQLLIKVIRHNTATLKEKLVQANLRKISFIHYVGLCSKVVASLPTEIKSSLSQYWAHKHRTRVPIKNIYTFEQML